MSNFTTQAVGNPQTNYTLVQDDLHSAIASAVAAASAFTLDDEVGVSDGDHVLVWGGTPNDGEFPVFGDSVANVVTVSGSVVDAGAGGSLGYTKQSNQTDSDNLTFTLDQWGVAQAILSISDGLILIAGDHAAEFSIGTTITFVGGPNDGISTIITAVGLSSGNTGISGSDPIVETGAVGTIQTPAPTIACNDLTMAGGALTTSNQINGSAINGNITLHATKGLSFGNFVVNLKSASAGQMAEPDYGYAILQGLDSAAKSVDGLNLAGFNITYVVNGATWTINGNNTYQTGTAFGAGAEATHTGTVTTLNGWNNFAVQNSSLTFNQSVNTGSISNDFSDASGNTLVFNAPLIIGPVGGNVFVSGDTYTIASDLTIGDTAQSVFSASVDVGGNLVLGTKNTSGSFTGTSAGNAVFSNGASVNIAGTMGMANCGTDFTGGGTAFNCTGSAVIGNQNTSGAFVGTAVAGAFAQTDDLFQFGGNLTTGPIGTQFGKGNADISVVGILVCPAVVLTDSAILRDATIPSGSHNISSDAKFISVVITGGIYDLTGATYYANIGQIINTANVLSLAESTWGSGTYVSTQWQYSATGGAGAWTDKGTDATQAADASGSWRCVITDSLGQFVPTDVVVVNLGALTAPSVSSGTPTTTTIPITWTASTGGANPYSYQVKYRIHGVANFTDFGSGTTSTSATITSLKPSTPYDIEVVNTDAASAVATSEVVTLTTLSAATSTTISGVVSNVVSANIKVNVSGVL